ncbi:MAG: ferritin-like domain-containing protein [Bacteroidota bacterium]
MKEITTERELYLELIQDMYHAEVLLIPELRLFIEKSSSETLKNHVQNHLKNSRLHVTRLEEIQENLNAEFMEEHCRTMKSMILETKELVERCSGNKLTDRAIAASLHRITQCQITVYQMLLSMADELNFRGHKKILQELLEDEQVFDHVMGASGSKRKVQA